MAAAAAGISAASSLLGGIVAGKGAKKAAKIQANAAAAINSQNLAFAQKTRDDNTALFQPTTDRGNAAGAQINALLGLGGDAMSANNAFTAFRDSSGYQDRFQAANDAVNTGYAARGALESGAAQKALQKNASVLAGDYFGQYLGALSGQQNAGLAGMSAVAGANTSFTNQAISSNTATGSAAASGSVNGVLGQTAAWQNALSGASRAAGNVFSSSYGSGGFSAPSLSSTSGSLSQLNSSLTPSAIGLKGWG